MPYEREGVRYHRITSEGWDYALTREDYIMRAARAMHETWMSWATNRGNIQLFWEESNGQCAAENVKEYLKTGEWVGFPNASWNSDKQIVSFDKEKGTPTYGPKPQENIDDQQKLQSLLKQMLTVLMEGAPNE